ncbi:MAG: DUF4435 domain-containing protein [Prevotella sp.]|nr:DUF4435 domain-containing protein [Prevotella sp.]
MKGKRLTDSLSSEWFEAANKLRPSSARRRIVVYVESYDDIFFWRSMLSRFENETRYFEILLPTKVGKLERGKKSAIMNLLTKHTGQYMLACVDADYDFLIQGVTPASHELISNRYVFHTYAYAIENLQCYAESLREVCVAVTLNDREVFNCAEYLRQYSQAIFPLFVWSIWHYRRPEYRDFTITDFNRVIETGNFTIEKAESIIQNIRRKVGSRISQLQKMHPDAKESYLQLKEELKQLGVTPDTTYLYIQGHHLFDKVVMPMLKKVCEKLIRQREEEIRRQSQHTMQQRNELSCYQRSLGNIEFALKKNLGYFRSDPVSHIQADLTSLLSPS